MQGTAHAIMAMTAAGLIVAIGTRTAAVKTTPTDRPRRRQPHPVATAAATAATVAVAAVIDDRTTAIVIVIVTRSGATVGTRGAAVATAVVTRVADHDHAAHTDEAGVAATIAIGGSVERTFVARLDVEKSRESERERTTTQRVLWEVCLCCSKKTPKQQSMKYWTKVAAVYLTALVAYTRDNRQQTPTKSCSVSMHE